MVGYDIAEEIREDYARGFSYRDLAEKYRMSFRDISEALRNEGIAMVRKVDLSQLLDRIEELEKRIEAASKVVRTALGDKKLSFICGKCGEWSTSQYNGSIWVCKKCGEKPF